ncbi:MAG: hypothetical protein IJ468_09110 [Lachnospiraceae bacterium]|nr:hypothetical protein [Lachnospiraceae bacterium]
MRKLIRNLLLLLVLVVLIIGGAVTYNWYRNREEITYVTMEPASLPAVELTCSDGGGNRLHGYLDEMDYKSMRQVITPLTERRQVTISIKTFGAPVDQVIYQLRSTDGERLVEDGVLDKWSTQDGVMTQELQLANLMEDGREYILMLMVKSGDQTIRYYSRVIHMEENSTAEMIAFIHSFSQATCSADPKMIINYIQPNDTMGMDDLSYINIHSRYGMFTWMNLQPVITGEVRTEITDLNASQMTAALYYPIALTSGETTRNYEVKEIFTVRYRNETMYLLDYERYMTEPFSVETMQYDETGIRLGAAAETSRSMSSPDGNVYAFVFQNQLWTWDAGNKQMTSVFSYRDGAEERSLLDNHTIDLVRVTDEGNVEFVVYGYHNRGIHEGHVGAAFYRYIREENRMDELFYIPSAVSEEIFQTQIGGLSYVSDSELLYFLYGNTMYSVDLTSQEKMELATQDEHGSFFRNNAENIVAWHESGEEKIVVMNLENGKLFRIQAQEGEFLQIQGFIGMDLIYGVGKNSDQGILDGSDPVSPLYKLQFTTVGETLEESGSYEISGIVILSADMGENSIEIRRASKNGAAYATISNDQVFVNDREANQTSGIMKSRIDDEFLKESYISLAIDAEKTTLVLEPCRFVERDASYVMDVDHLEDEVYYAYGRSELLGAYQQLSEAIDAAYEAMGVVTDHAQHVLWTRGTRDLYKNLTLEQEVCDSESRSLAAALKMMLEFEGASSAGVDAKLAAGETAAEILSAFLKGRVMDLQGCSVSHVLYYIHMGHPVLVQTGENSAVLILGYETGGVTVYNPYNGVVTPMTTGEAEAYFSDLGSHYYSYLELK